MDDGTGGWRVDVGAGMEGLGFDGGLMEGFDGLGIMMGGFDGGVWWDRNNEWVRGWRAGRGEGVYG